MSESTIRVSLIAPTYNEKENIRLLTEEIFSVLKNHNDIDLELIVVDDNSPDGTGAAAESLKESFPVRVIHRCRKSGLGSAVWEGFELSARPFLGVIDADLSHDPALIPELIYALRNHDIAIGSRYNSGSRTENWPWYRKLISKTGIFFARKLTRVKDPLAGYFFLNRNVVKNMTLTSPGYKILLEILVKGNYSKVTEIPFVFRNRQFNVSKLNLSEYYLFIKQLVFFGFKKWLSLHKKA